MTRSSTESDLDTLKDILGLDLPADRLDDVLKAYADILVELRKLRQFDLTDVHPAVVFDPAEAFGGEDGT